MSSFRPLKARAAQGLRASALHIGVSIVVVAVVALLIFQIWFPDPLRKLTGGTELFWLIAGVDIICGPLLTFIVFNPAKQRSELFRDLTTVALIQLVALGYGIYTLSQARPIAVVYEVDRFRIITTSDIDEAEIELIPEWAKSWSFSQPRTLGLRAATTTEEQMASIDASLQGVEPSQRPSWWQDYALSLAQILRRSHSMALLHAKHPDYTVKIDSAAAQAVRDIRPGETTDPKELRWLPLVSRRSTDWIVLLDPSTARIRGYLHLDGF